MTKTAKQTSPKLPRKVLAKLSERDLAKVDGGRYHADTDPRGDAGDGGVGGGGDF